LSLRPAALALALLAGCASASDRAGGRASPPRPPAAQATQVQPPHATAAVRLAPGEVHTAVEGCLAAGSEAEAARFPARPATRTLAPTVTVAAVAGGAVVTHQVSHACCLRAEVTTRSEERTVTVLETLSGKACRCMCASTLRTRLGLAPGAWTVAVELDLGAGQGRRRLASQEVTVGP